MKYWNAILKLAISGDVGLAINNFGVNRIIVLSIYRFYLNKCYFESCSFVSPSNVLYSGRLKVSC